MKNKNYHAVRTVPKFNIKIIEIGKIDTCTPNTQTTCTSIKSLYMKKNCNVYTVYNFFVLKNLNYVID